MLSGPAEQLQEWIDDLLKQELTIEEAKRRHAGLKTLIHGWLQIHPELSDMAREVTDVFPAPTSADAPKGAEAVRIILQEHIDTRFYVSELVDLLRERGWLPESDNPANAVRAAVERLTQAEDSDVYKVSLTNGKVAYRYSPDFERATARRPVVNPAPAGYDPTEEPF